MQTETKIRIVSGKLNKQALKYYNFSQFKSLATKEAGQHQNCYVEVTPKARKVLNLDGKTGIDKIQMPGQKTSKYYRLPDLLSRVQTYQEKFIKIRNVEKTKDFLTFSMNAALTILLSIPLTLGIARICGYHLHDIDSSLVRTGELVMLKGLALGIGIYVFGKRLEKAENFYISLLELNQKTAPDKLK